MEDEQDKTQITVVLDKSSSPYEDENLVETQPDTPFVNQREPFNDVIKHGDIVTGYQRNRTLSDYPRRIRPWVRLYAIGTLLILVLGIIWGLFRH